MSKTVSICTRLILSIIILFSALVIAPQSVHAQEIITDGRVPAGTVVENDTLIFGDDIVVDGDVDGDLFAFGRSVTVNGNVSGSMLTVAGVIDVNGEVGGSLYAIARALTLGTSSTVHRNVYYAGIRLFMEEESTVSRDLVGVSLSAQIAGKVGRDFKAIIGLLNFVDLFTAPETPQSGGEPEPTEESDASSSESSSTGSLILTSAGFGKPLYKLALQTTNDSGGLNSSQKQGVTTEAVVDWLLERLQVYITLLVLGGLVLWLIPIRMNYWSNTVKSKPGLSTGYGLLSLVIVANAMAIVILIAILILIVGLWLGAVTFWNLAFIFWGVAFSVLGLAFTLFIVFVFYISKAILAFLVGSFILNRLSERAAGYKLLVLALGLLIFVLLAGLPYVGWFISLLATVLGLGAILVAYRDARYAIIRGEVSAEALAEGSADERVDESTEELAEDMAEKSK
jgi:cytoskeletal protein CcmA (bactofilin family)